MDSRQCLKLRGKRQDKGAENCIMKSFMSRFLDNIIRVIKSRRKKKAEHLANIG
jgi:hypothetical protein